MRLIIAFLVLIPFIGSSQNCDNCNLEYLIISKNGCYSYIKQIKKNDVEQYKSYCNEPSYYKLSDYSIINSNDSIERILIEKYPNNFVKSENGFDFIDASGVEVVINNITSKDIKMNQVYNIKALIGDYLIIYMTGYEWWTYHLFNLKTFQHYILPGPPVFVNPDYFYGYTNYYGSGEIKFIDTKNNKDISLMFEESITTVGHSSNLSMGTLLHFTRTKCNETIYLNIKNQ